MKFRKKSRDDNAQNQDEHAGVGPSEPDPRSVSSLPPSRASTAASQSLPLRRPSNQTGVSIPVAGGTPEAGPLGLNVIFTPDNGHKVDIVFIHGLGGTSRGTWTKSRNPEKFWPLTFLPLEPDICLARIMTFGYSATFQATGNVTTSVLDFAKDLLFDLKYAKDQNLDDLDVGSVPLIFVVHSMGGLIVKEVGLARS